MALRAHVFGKRIILDMHTKKGYRVSPPANYVAKNVGKECRGVKGAAAARKCLEEAAKSAKP